MIALKKYYIRKIFAAFMAAAVMSSFAAVSIYAEPDMVVDENNDDDAEAEFTEDEEPETSDEDIVPEESDNEEAPSDGDGDGNEDEEGEPPAEEDPGDDFVEPVYTPTGDVTMYALDTVNIRKGPGTDYDKLGLLYKDGSTTVKGYIGEWMAIDYYGGTGYVLSSFLSKTAPVVTTTTTAAPLVTAPDFEEPEDVTVDTEPVTEVTIAPEEETPVVTTEETEAPTTKPAKDETDEDNKDAAAVTDSSDKKSGGLQGILIAGLCALAAFILIGIVPVVIHRIHHKKLYQY